MNEFSVIDFFSGCGGTSLGLQAAGMNVLAGLDVDVDSANTFRSWFPRAEFIEGDIREVKTDAFEALLGSVPDSIRVFAGCAPCQPFSRQRRGSEKDGRSDLLLEFLRFVVYYLPHFVVVENVPGMQNVSESSGVFSTFVTSLRENGYSVASRVVRASDYGVPQTRRRLLLVASRVGPAELPEATHGEGLLTPVTVRDAIWGLPPIQAGEKLVSDELHVSMNLSTRNLLRMKATPEGGDRRDWPTELVLECHTQHSGHTDTYGRLSWDRPASALTTKCLSYSNGRYGHPEQDRAISAREAALLQTFPPSVQFSGNLGSKARQIGNAVPPLLAERVGQTIVDSLIGLRGWKSSQVLDPAVSPRTR